MIIPSLTLRFSSISTCSCWATLCKDGSLFGILGIMIAVIIAGGSGTRLWPLSTPNYPKHLLKLAGDQLSLLQNTYQRAKRIADTVYVVSEVGHIEHVKKQLPDLDAQHLVAEPARRGTASCMAAVFVRIADDHNDEETIAFLPADHYVRDSEGFAQSFKQAAKISKNYSKIVTIGVDPSYPATGFGYIKKNKSTLGDEALYEVEAFVEKPDYETAKEYVKSGNYLWSCSYFVGSIGSFKKMMQLYAPQLFNNFNKLLSVSDAAYENTYLSFENISIEYAMIVKAQGLLAVPASFDWMDVGSFMDLHKVVDSDKDGNYTQGIITTKGLENSFVQNDEQKPLIVIGLDNVVVVNTPNGILVARKDLSQLVGDASKQIETDRKN